MSTSSGYLQTTYKLMDTAGQLRGLRDDGFALIPNVLNSEEVALARAEIDRLRPFHWDIVGVGKPGGIDHYKCVFNRDPYWLQFLDRAGLIELAEASLGKECHSIGMSAWRSHPNSHAKAHEIDGLDPTEIHTDHVFFPVKEELLLSGQVEVPILLCTAHYYLSDITIDLCPTWVIPGSHKSGGSTPIGAKSDPQALLEWRGNKAQPVLVKAGDVLFFRSDLLHAGSRNRSQQVRYLLQVHLSNRMVAQKFSPYIAWQFSPHVLALATPRQRRLLGDHVRSAYD